MKEPLCIIVEDVSKQVNLGQDTLDILHGINWQVKSGDTVSIMGASGSGKTTFLSLLAGLDLPTSGQIWIDDQPLHQLTEEARAALRLQRIGFVFQSFFLLPQLSACENVMLPMQLQGQRDARKLAMTLLERVGLGARANNRPGQLSGGEQQRVALARAFGARPTLLLADEPTGNLDYATGKMVAEQLFELNQAFGTTLVVVTHDAGLAERCHQQYLMHQGHLSSAHP